MPIYTIELDRGSGDIITWEFYDTGVVRFRDTLTDCEEWAPAWEYDIE